MTHRHIHFGDRSRQAALFETMILAAGADGVVTKDEIEEIYRRVFERPEFKGIQTQDLRDALQHAADQVAKEKDLAHLLPSIAKRLPEATSRQLAFGLAASVAMANRKQLPHELQVLKALQRAFDIADADVVELFDAAERHAPLPTHA